MSCYNIYDFFINLTASDVVSAKLHNAKSSDALACPTAFACYVHFISVALAIGCKVFEAPDLAEQKMGPHCY